MFHFEKIIDLQFHNITSDALKIVPNTGKSVHFKNTVTGFSFCSKLSADFVLISVENDHNFEQNENLATVILK